MDIAAARQPAFKPRSEPTDGGKFYGDTESRRQFVSHTVEKPVRRAKRLYEPNPAKFEATSESAAVFARSAGAPMERVKPFKPHSDYKPNSGRFDGTTTAAANYQAFDISAARQPSHKPVSEPIPPAKFDGTTENRRNFVGHRPDPPPRREPRKYVPNPAKFDGRTEALEKFVASNTTPAKPFKPKGEYNPLGGRFDGTTSNSANYRAFDIAAARQQPYKPKPQPTGGGRFEGATEASRSFVEHTVPKVYKKTPRKYEPNPAKFDGTTESSAVFARDPAAPVERVASYKPRGEYQPAPGKFDGVSTSAANFTAFDPRLARQPPAKPKAQPRPNYKFDATSEARRTFVAHVPDPPKRREPRKYVPNTDKFESRTESSMAFKGDSVERAPAFKPKGEFNMMGGKFQAETENRSRFGGSEVKPMKRFEPPKPEIMQTKFEGMSSAQADFGDRSMPPPPKSLKPKSEPLRTGKFEATTTAGAAFTTKGFDERQQPFKPQHHGAMFEGKFDGTTTSKADFRANASPVRRENLKPRREPYRATKFEGETEAHRAFAVPTDYTRQPAVVRSNNYRPPSGKFDGVTTSNAAFRAVTPDVCLGTILANKKAGAARDIEMLADGKPVGAKRDAQSRHGHRYHFTEKDVTTGHEFYVVESGRT